MKDQAPAASSISSHVHRLAGQEPGWTLAYHLPAWRRLAPLTVAFLGIATLGYLLFLCWRASIFCIYSPPHPDGRCWDGAIDVLIVMAFPVVAWALSAAQQLGRPGVLRGPILGAGRTEGGAPWIKIPVPGESEYWPTAERAFSVPAGLLDEVRPGQEAIVEHNGAYQLVTLLVREPRGASEAA